jgi:hypothetical protein
MDVRLLRLHPFSHPPLLEQRTIPQLYIAAQAERIYKNIGYAISTRSNHTISEAFGLWMVGLLFPELKRRRKIFQPRQKLLEEEAAKQIFPDGSYAMYSLNYHRFILHLYLYAIRLGELNNLQFSNSLHSSISSSIEYLSHLIDPATGTCPSTAPTTARSSCLSTTATSPTTVRCCNWAGTSPNRNSIFEPGPWDEDVYWLCGENYREAR